MPLFSAASMTHTPPSSAARSRIEVSPTPSRASFSIPIPSSVISTVNAVSLAVRRTAQWRACACRAAEIFTLVSAHPATNRETQTRAAHYFARLKEEMSTDILAAAQERGRTLKLGEAVTSILQWAQSELGAQSERGSALMA